MDSRVSEEFGSSESTGAGSGILKRLPFMRQHHESDSPRTTDDENLPPHLKTTSPGKGGAPPQHEFARRKASLRKVVLGRETVRDGRDAEQLGSDIGQSPADAHEERQPALSAGSESDSHSENSDVTPWPEFDDRNDGHYDDDERIPIEPPRAATTSIQVERLPTKGLASPPISYKSISTTDDDDGLHMAAPPGKSSFPSNLSFSTGLDTFFTTRKPAVKRRPSEIARAPLSYSAVGLSTTSILPGEEDDYGETEAWGWVVLAVTWFVFVTGVGSCFDVWSWAWDVGRTPYAPPEFEDDPTLPIVGYYPALMVLTCVMAWIWVVIAWVGMKYFRHAKITGD